LRIDHRLGPKPKKYSVTFIPDHLAVMKWPVSWIMTMAMMARMKATTGKVPAATDQAMPSATRATMGISLPRPSSCWVSGDGVSGDGVSGDGVSWDRVATGEWRDSGDVVVCELVTSFLCAAFS